MADVVHLDPWQDIVEVGWPSQFKWLMVQYFGNVGEHDTNYPSPECAWSGGGGFGGGYHILSSDEEIHDALGGPLNYLVPPDRIPYADDATLIGLGCPDAPGTSQERYMLRRIKIQGSSLPETVSVSGLKEIKVGKPPPEWTSAGSALRLGEGPSNIVFAQGYGEWAHPVNEPPGIDTTHADHRDTYTAMSPPSQNYVAQVWKDAHTGDMEVPAPPTAPSGHHFKAGAPTLTLTAYNPVGDGCWASGNLPGSVSYLALFYDGPPGGTEDRRIWLINHGTFLGEGSLDLSAVTLKYKKRTYTYVGHYAQLNALELYLLFEIEPGTPSP